MEDKKPKAFVNLMSRNQTVLGCCYVPIHGLALPILLSIYAAFAPESPDELQINALYYIISMSFVLVVMWKYLRASFDPFVDKLGFCLIAIALAYCAGYAMSIPVTVIMTALEDIAPNPNNEMVGELAKSGLGMTVAFAVFLAPIVEETLFRGAVFGSLLGKNRFAAYGVSALLFGVYHVWQYALVYGDGAVLIHAIDYIPLSIALAWCYERTNSIWPPIFLHMLQNGISMLALSMM